MIDDIVCLKAMINDSISLPVKRAWKQILKEKGAIFVPVTQVSIKHQNEIMIPPDDMEFEEEETTGKQEPSRP